MSYAYIIFWQKKTLIFIVFLKNNVQNYHFHKNQLNT